MKSEIGTYLEVCTSIGCKVNCSFCPQKPTIEGYRLVSNLKSMALADFKSCLAKMSLNSHIVFSGFVEPFLNKETHRMIQLAHDSGHSVSVYTALVGLTKEQFLTISKIPFVQFRIHLPDDGNTMNVKVSSAYLDTLQAIVDAAIPNLKFIVIGDTLDKLIKIVATDQIIFRIPHSRAGNLPGQEKIRHAGKIKCAFNNHYKNILLPDGSIVLCSNDFGIKHVLGNLLHETFDTIYTGDVFRTILEGLADEKSDILCRTCEFGVPEDISEPDISSYNKHLTYFDRIK